MRLIDADELIAYFESDLRGEEYQKYILEMIDIHARLNPIDAVPISFIERRIEQLKSHADYEFEENGGYAGGSQYRLWELECLLDAWMKRKDEQ